MSPTNDSIAVRASALKFLSYFATACSSYPQKDARNTLIICCTREAFIQTLLDEHDAIVGDGPVVGLAYDGSNRHVRTSDAGSSSPHDVEVNDREEEGGILQHDEIPNTGEEEEEESKLEALEGGGGKELVIKDSEGESSDELLSDGNHGSGGSEQQLPPEDWPESPPPAPGNITQPPSKNKPSSQVQSNPRSSSPVLQHAHRNEEEAAVIAADLPFGFSAKIEELTSASKVHKLVFCPSLPHLRAYIASISFNNSKSNSSRNAGSLLGIYNLFSIHSPLELSVQGISRTLSAAVDATVYGKLVVCVREDDEKSTLRLANVGMVGKGLKSFGGDGFEEDEGDQGEIEGRWNVPLEDVLGRWMKIEAVE